MNNSTRIERLEEWLVTQKAAPTPATVRGKLFQIREHVEAAEAAHAELKNKHTVLKNTAAQTIADLEAKHAQLEQAHADLKAKHSQLEAEHSKLKSPKKDIFTPIGRPRRALRGGFGQDY